MAPLRAPLRLALLALLGLGLVAQPQPCTQHADAVTTVSARAASTFELGRAVGRATRTQIAARLAAREASAALAFAATPAGAALVAQLLANANASFPQFVAELDGLAAGAGVAFADVFVLNALDELETVMPPWPPGPDSARIGHCSDVLVGPPAGSAGARAPRLVAHNEDAEVSEFGAMFLLEASVPAVAQPPGGAQVLSFSAFMYAGTLPSGAFAFNGFGVYFSTNALFPLSLDTGGVPRSFVHRHVLEAVSVTDAAARLAAARVACGFSINLGGVGAALAAGEAPLRNVEMSAVLPASTHAVGAGDVYYHANSYIHSATPQFDDVSSDARLARMAQLPAPQWPGAQAGASVLLGDTLNATYPIFRAGALPDCCATVMTMAIAVAVDEATGEEVGTLSLLPNNPLLCPDPILTRTFSAAARRGRDEPGTSRRG
jgi:hypothetical protein